MTQLILTADPTFADLALDELRRDTTAAQVQATLDPGVLLVSCQESFWELAEQWRQAPPIFVRHICPVQETVELRGRKVDLTTLAELVTERLVPLFEPDWPFSVQTRIFADLDYKPYDVNTALADAVRQATDLPLDVRKPAQILSVVCADTAEGPMAFLGLSPAVHNLSDWAGGMRRFAREKEQISRAEFKLLEALEVFGIELPPRGVALDLGAAPGGWTRVLRQHDQYVTAVDPAKLDERLAADVNVRHKCMTAEAYLNDEPDRFDVIVNDMRMDARDSARLMVRYAEQLYPGGIVIMTFKLPEQGRRSVLEHAFAILEQAYERLGARQLFHNRSEVTVYLQRR